MVSKRYRSAREVANLDKSYGLDEAIEIILKMPRVKFDETIELAGPLFVNPKQSDQMVRGIVKLPHGSGRVVRVLVFTEKPDEALAAGADFAGLDDMMKKVEHGWLDFDVVISTTSAMKSVRSLAKVLGPRGLMPNPKSGTVTDDVAQAIQEVKTGRVEYKMDKTGNIAVVVGKSSFKPAHLFENARAVLDAIGKSKPASFNGKLIKSLFLSTTMSPAVKLDSKEFAHY